MYGFTRRVVAAERKADVGYAAGYFGVRQIGPDPACRLNEIDAIVAVFIDAGGDGENVWIKNDVFRRIARGLHQQGIGAFAYFYFAGKRVGLAFFIEGHDDDRSTIAPA